ncbi:hypothetical protein Syun_010056 [Stephania yunnanensis]|uniref:Uncharacterized protein n=1 Tax=Stephania yunnanensis TaxID=152371 RepID=A0AAP0PPN2_9MAGN
MEEGDTSKGFGVGCMDTSENCSELTTEDEATGANGVLWELGASGFPKTEGEGGELEATAPETGNAMCPNLEVDSWTRFEFHELNFVGGAPLRFLPSKHTSGRAVGNLAFF